MSRQLGELLDASTDIKIYTCEDFGGNIEVTIGKYMYLFYMKTLSNSTDIQSETPVDIFNMDIEQPTPGSENYIQLDIADTSVNDIINTISCHF